MRHDETFVGQTTMDIPKAVSVGYTPVFHAHTAQVAVKFMELLEKTNKSGKEAALLPQDWRLSHPLPANQAHGHRANGYLLASSLRYPRHG